MDGDFFNPGHDDLFLGESLNSPDHFPGVLNITPSNFSPVDDANTQLVRASTWWDESLHLNDLGPNGLQPNGLQPDDLQHIPPASHDRILYKTYTNPHNMQPPQQGDFMAGQGAGNVHVRATSPWIGFQYRQSMGNAISQDPERPVIYKSSSIYDQQQYVIEPQHMSAFSNSYRDSNDISIPPVLFPSQFTAADLGRIPQPSNADDTASLAYTQASCNSKCISSVCENENCSETGTPCNDPACVENAPPVGMLDLADHGSTQISSQLAHFHQSHTQPCNHTESEHIVARTLGELRAPAELAASEKTQYTTTFDYPLVSSTGDQFYDDNHQAYPSPSQPPTEAESFVSTDPHMSLQSIPPLFITPGEVTNPERHICQWVAHSGGTICGAEFSNTKDFHNHLCEFHIDKLTSQTGFACLWAGCSRTHDRPFVTRGKLRRHVSTHSVYKPYTCEICKQGFSGQQALQQHERIHTGLKPFKCTVEGCTMAFKQKSALTMHSRVHTGEKPLQCEYCGKAFPESSNLSKHRKIHLVKSNKYICEEIVKGEPCGRSFRRLDQLRRHRQTHLNPGKRKAVSMSTTSNTSGEALQFMQSPVTTSGETQ